MEYALRLARVRNFSQVAEELKISQPALSKQILQLESELGVKLFDRNTNPLTLTPAGPGAAVPGGPAGAVHGALSLR